MVRGPCTGYHHGEVVNGSRFFGGGWGEPVDGHWGNSWGQSSGINAGVMLLKPDMALSKILFEIKASTSEKIFRRVATRHDATRREES